MVMVNWVAFWAATRVSAESATTAVKERIVGVSAVRCDGVDVVWNVYC